MLNELSIWHCGIAILQTAQGQAYAGVRLGISETQDFSSNMQRQV